MEQKPISEDGLQIVAFDPNPYDSEKWSLPITCAAATLHQADNKDQFTLKCGVHVDIKPRPPPLSDVGGPCGGGTEFSPSCRKGLQCKYPAAKGKYGTGFKGTCERIPIKPHQPPPSPVGGPCGGGTRFSPTCQKGLRCNYPAADKGGTGFTGTCEQIPLTHTCGGCHGTDMLYRCTEEQYKQDMQTCWASGSGGSGGSWGSGSGGSGGSGSGGGGGGGGSRRGSGSGGSGSGGSGSGGSWGSGSGGCGSGWGSGSGGGSWGSGSGSGGSGWGSGWGSGSGSGWALLPSQWPQQQPQSSGYGSLTRGQGWGYWNLFL